MENFEFKDFEIIGTNPLFESSTSKLFLSKNPKREDSTFVIKCYKSPEKWKREKSMLLNIKEGCSKKIRDRFLFPEDYAEGSNAPILFIIFPKIGISLKQYFSKKETVNDEMVTELRRILSTSVVPALNYLHDSQIVHGDICAENILQGIKAPNHWVLIDFGSSAYIDDYVLPGKYIPPEYKVAKKNAKNGETPKPRATVGYDNFAVGIMMVEILLLFNDKFWDNISKHKDYLNASIPIVIPSKISEYGKLKRGIDGLLVKSPFDRFRLDQFTPYLEYNTDNSISNMLENDLNSPTGNQPVFENLDEMIVPIIVPSEEWAIKVSLGDLEPSAAAFNGKKNRAKESSPIELISNSFARLTTNFKIGLGITILVAISVVIVLALTLKSSSSPPSPSPLQTNTTTATSLSTSNSSAFSSTTVLTANIASTT